MKSKIAFILVLVIILSTSVVFADGNWGQNVGSWVKTQVWWIALAVIAVVATKYAAKKMWVQFGGFIVLAGIVLVIVESPEKLKAVGTTLWNIVFK